MLHLPSRTVRLRLTLLYGGLFLVSGVALLAATYLLFRRSTGVELLVPTGTPRGSGGAGALNDALRHPNVARQVHQMYAAAVKRDSHDLHDGLIQSGIALAIMTAVSIALGWLVAGRVLSPLRTMTATTRRISERNLNERLAFSGPRDELKDLADTVDGLLGRLEAHVAEQQRFAANASHELRTPLAVAQTLLDVARNDPNRDNGELLERLHAVNSRAIELTEALLLLTRADQRSFTREHVDLSSWPKKPPRRSSPSQNSIASQSRPPAR
jgi:two-component system, OmpR family, sensor histidine kinase VanS